MGLDLTILADLGGCNMEDEDEDLDEDDDNDKSLVLCF